MNKCLLPLLKCPKSGTNLHIENSPNHNYLQQGHLSSKNGHTYPIIDGIPRFVDSSNYADTFGLQWNHFAKTQLDSYSGHKISFDRFWESTNWGPDQMNDKWVLDMGCGSGRFAEIALETGANVVALDFSKSVDACYDNLKSYPNLHVVQGDVYDLPFKQGAFHYIYSLGVLQHTPDVKNAFLALVPHLAKGGHLCVDIYEKSWKSFFSPKYYIRPITTRIAHEKLFKSIGKLVPFLFKFSSAVRRIPFFGSVFVRMLPIANYQGVLPLTHSQHIDWSTLDTFDMLSPRYDQPQTRKTLHSWMKSAEIKNIEILSPGHLVARGQKEL